MSKQIKDQKTILEKLGIKQLNQMQKNAAKAIRSNEETIILSPTGTGKTLAFLLPVIAELDPNLDQIQALILVPSRELAIQIEQVVRELGSGFKTNVVYGGRAGSKEKVELKHTPAILVGTPGRVADHMRRGRIDTQYISHLILDEFDKSLEVGFEKEMKGIVSDLKLLKKKILTSATQLEEMPDFMELEEPKELNYLDSVRHQLKIKTIVAPKGNRLESLEMLLGQLEGNGIIFCSLKNTIEGISNYFDSRDIGHSCFYGGMEQVDRERALIKFRNGTKRFLVATDLAARGIDVPELDFIVHFETPFREEEFTHRNGRTARMNSQGTAYVMKWEGHALPDFVDNKYEEPLNELSPAIKASQWETLHISGGRKDKISKGDIAGLFFKQGNIDKTQLGAIELKTDCAFVAVDRSKTFLLIEKLNNTKLKKKKVRITLA